MRICFTGHRPSKLGGYDYQNSFNKKIRLRIREEVLNIINNSNDKEFNFIFGGALGVDQFAFNVVLLLKHELKDKVKIALEVAIPFKDQPNAWFKEEDKQRYFKQIECTDKVTYVDRLEEYKTNVAENVYSAAKLQIRNKYMVDNSDLVIAVWDGTKSGTCNCVNYAKKLSKSILQINPKEIK